MVACIIQVLKRMFPIDRGLYEDKVANFWCAISPAIKLRQLFATSDIVKIWYVLAFSLTWRTIC